MYDLMNPIHRDGRHLYLQDDEGKLELALLVSRGHIVRIRMHESPVNLVNRATEILCKPVQILDLEFVDSVLSGRLTVMGTSTVLLRIKVLRKTGEIYLERSQLQELVAAIDGYFAQPVEDL